MCSGVNRKKSISARSLLIIASMCSLAVACASCADERINHYANERMKEVAHPNGLIIRLAHTLLAKEDANGFSIAPHESAQRRYPTELSVALHADGRRPEGEWTAQRRINNRLLHYRTSEAQYGGASGSEIEHRIEAWEDYGGRYVLYQQSFPNVSYEQGVDLFWHIIEGTSLTAKK